MRHQEYRNISGGSPCCHNGTDRNGSCYNTQIKGMSVHLELCQPWSGCLALHGSSSQWELQWRLFSLLYFSPRNRSFFPNFPTIKTRFSRAPSNSCCMIYGWIESHTEEKLMLLLQDSAAAPDFIWTPGLTYTYSKIKKMFHEKDNIKLVYQINPIKNTLVLGMVHYLGMSLSTKSMTIYYFFKAYLQWGHF